MSAGLGLHEALDQLFEKMAEALEPRGIVVATLTKDGEAQVRVRITLEVLV